jgi:natural product precursor
MKEKNLLKLKLNKEMIATLNQADMQFLVGGNAITSETAAESFDVTCVPCYTSDGCGITNILPKTDI